MVSAHIETADQALHVVEQQPHRELSVLKTFRLNLENYLIPLINKNPELFFSPDFTVQFKEVIKKLIFKYLDDIDFITGFQATKITQAQVAVREDALSEAIKKLSEDFYRARDLSAAHAATTVEFDILNQTTDAKIAGALCSATFVSNETGTSPTLRIKVEFMEYQTDPEVNYPTIVIMLSDNAPGEPVSMEILVETDTFQTVDKNAAIDLNEYLQALGLGITFPRDTFVIKTDATQPLNLQPEHEEQITTALLEMVGKLNAKATLGVDSLDTKHYWKDMNIATNYTDLRVVLNNVLLEIASEFSEDDDEVETAGLMSAIKQVLSKLQHSLFFLRDYELPEPPTRTEMDDTKLVIDAAAVITICTLLYLQFFTSEKSEEYTLMTGLYLTVLLSIITYVGNPFMKVEDTEKTEEEGYFEATQLVEKPTVK